MSRYSATSPYDPSGYPDPNVDKDWLICQTAYHACARTHPQYVVEEDLDPDFIQGWEEHADELRSSRAAASTQCTEEKGKGKGKGKGKDNTTTRGGAGRDEGEEDVDDGTMETKTGRRNKVHFAETTTQGGAGPGMSPSLPSSSDDADDQEEMKMEKKEPVVSATTSIPQRYDPTSGANERYHSGIQTFLQHNAERQAQAAAAAPNATTTMWPALPRKTELQGYLSPGRTQSTFRRVMKKFNPLSSGRDSLTSPLGYPAQPTQEATSAHDSSSAGFTTMGGHHYDHHHQEQQQHLHASPAAPSSLSSDPPVPGAFDSLPSTPAPTLAHTKRSWRTPPATDLPPARRHSSIFGSRRKPDVGI